MFKRKQAIIVAAALAAAPLAAQAAVTVAFAYDTTVTYASNTAFTAGTGTVAIINNQVTVPSGDFFQFNVNVLVTGDTNSATGGAYDQANGTTQPPNLGLLGFGFIITDSSVANVIPRIVGGNAVVTLTTAGGPYDFIEKAVNSATGQVGTTNAPLSGGLFAPGVTGPAGYYKLTLGANSPADIFTGLTYQALTSGQAVLTPSNTRGSVAYVVASNGGTTSTPPQYNDAIIGFQDPDGFLDPLPALTINPAVPEPSSAVIMLAGASSLLFGRHRRKGLLDSVG